MSRTVAYKPPQISRRTYQLGAIVLSVLGLLTFSDFLVLRGVGTAGPITEGIGILVLLAAGALYLLSRRWSNCPHCRKDVRRIEAVCPSCGKRIFGETT